MGKFKGDRIDCEFSESPSGREREYRLSRASYERFVENELELNKDKFIYGDRGFGAVWIVNREIRKIRNGRQEFGGQN